MKRKICAKIVAERAAYMYVGSWGNTEARAQRDGTTKIFLGNE